MPPGRCQLRPQPAATPRAALPHSRPVCWCRERATHPLASISLMAPSGAFSEALRREVYRDNIRVTIIEPGAVATELRDHVPDPDTRERIDTWARQHGLRYPQAGQVIRTDTALPDSASPILASVAPVRVISTP